MKKTVSVDVDINTGDVIAWLFSGVSELDLYAIMRNAALQLGRPGVEFLRENVPYQALTEHSVASLLAAETFIGVLEAEEDAKDEDE